MVQVLFGDAINIVLFVLVVAGVMKIFQMAGDVRELKETLVEIKRSSQDIPLPIAARQASVPPPMTPEELVRSVHSQRFSDDEYSALEPTVMPPQS